MDSAPIYLDSNATTRVHPEVVQAMIPYFSDTWYNPSSGYRASDSVKEALATARTQIAELIQAQPDEIVFTGCGTESNNMVLKSLARTIGRKHSRAVTSQIEHSAVLRPLQAMADVGFDVVHCPVQPDGRLHLDALRTLLTADRPGLLSLMWANNETGIIQPIKEAATLAKKAGWWVHTDAIQ
ncbi:MAG: aminotransferase class V-fold PLP-dependent enzyme, partial [Verrucomicrobiota bacterium]